VTRPTFILQLLVLGFLAVSPNAQRLGAGSALVKWGCDRADQDGLPIFVSGSLVAAPLYAKFGFVAKDWSVIKYPITGKEVMQTNMMREPKTTQPDAVHSTALASSQKVQIGSEP
jgi:predicted N-acetyltransferase YhbS